MADILIKNIEMPESCITGKIPYYEYCPFFGDCSKASAKTERPSDCPLVALPSHGRLIDADEFKASIHMNHLGKFATNRDVQVLYKLLDEAPVIVEATE